MTIITETNTVAITLKSLERGNWGSDCFDDLETNFPQDHERADGGYEIIATDDDVNDLINWWQGEVDSANADPDYEGDGLCADGKEWMLTVIRKEL